VGDGILLNDEVAAVCQPLCLLFGNRIRLSFFDVVRSTLNVCDGLSCWYVMCDWYEIGWKRRSVIEAMTGFLQASEDIFVGKNWCCNDDQAVSEFEGLFSWIWVGRFVVKRKYEFRDDDAVPGFRCSGIEHSVVGFEFSRRKHYGCVMRNDRDKKLYAWEGKVCKRN